MHPDFVEQELERLGKRIADARRLLDEYQARLVFLDDPRERAKSKHAISQLEESVDEYTQKYTSLKAQLDAGTTPSQNLEEQLTSIETNLDVLKGGQNSIVRQLARTRVTYQFILAGEVDEVSQQKLADIVKYLQNLSGDISIELKRLSAGSIILELEGYEEGYKILEALYKEGKLTEILGLRIRRIQKDKEGLASQNNKNSPVEVFFSYSHKDEKLRDELAVHLSILERNGTISGWHDRKIPAGDLWADKIDEQINSAKIIMLLVSSDFIASDYCWNIEVKRAMERHESGEACVIPILLRPVNWKTAPFGKLQALPKDAKPVTNWNNPDEAFTNISHGIEAIANRFLTKSE